MFVGKKEKREKNNFRDLKIYCMGEQFFLFFSHLFLTIYFYRDLHNLLSVLGMEEQPLPLLWTADFILGIYIFFFDLTKYLGTEVVVFFTPWIDGKDQIN